MTPGAGAERFAAYQARVAAAVDDQLRALLSGPPELLEAMRYSVFGGGQRLRPVLCVAAAEAVGGTVEAALPAACALELVHTYSLIHDDLPAMDDDALRRGRPTSHVVFGEALALLAGDALLALAFATLARAAGRFVPPEHALAAVEVLATAAGAEGMVGGQVLDLRLAGVIGGPAAEATVDALREAYDKKTGRLFAAAVQLGGLFGGAGPGLLAALERYGRAVGLAYQIVDDLADLERDAARGQGASLPLAAGASTARALAADACTRALAALAPLGAAAGPLADFVAVVQARLGGG